MKYDRSERILHFGLVVFILIQLIMTQFIGLPEPGHVRRGSDALLVGIHELVGVLALISVCALLIIVLDDPAGRRRLMPWLDQQGRAALWLALRRDVPGWLTGRIPLPETGGALAGAVHGAGALLALLLGLTGAMLFIGMGVRGKMPPDIRPVWTAHEFLADAMWVFLVGHAAMTLVHEFRGHRIARAMFRLGKSGED